MAQHTSAPTPPAVPTPPARTAGELRHFSELRAFFDRFATEEPRWRRRNLGYHRLVESIYRFLIPRGASVLEVGSGSGDLLASLEPSRAVGIDVSPGMVELARRRHPQLEFTIAAGESFDSEQTFDYVVLSDLVPFSYDLLSLFKNLARLTHPRSRIVLHSYSQLWRPAIRLAELTGLKRAKPIRNWVTPEDVRNLLALADFEVVSVERRILLPKRVPLLATLLNGVIAHVWPFSWLCLTYWVVARPRQLPERVERAVSVVVPCRNEEGNIAAIIERVPELGGATEILFVEGGSRDGTRAEIELQIAAHPERRITLHEQRGTGKADAVRLGFEQARGDVLIILDGDLSVAPEDLPPFYDVLAEGRAEFVNGSRLVYGLEEGAMRFLNVVGNKFFSLVFTYLMRQPVKDTLCGTKVLLRDDYETIARQRADFGDFDPFGDFDLLLGAARIGAKIVDLPVRYHARSYGRTNISRFRHGWLLLKMSVIAFYMLKVRPVRSRR